MDVQQALAAVAEEEYRAFQEKLIPGAQHILGVRLPQLRKITAQIVREGAEDFLNDEPGSSFEETMLRGMVIGKLRLPPEQVMGYIRDFVPKIDNWATCDTFCTDLKIAVRYPDLFWDFIQPYLMDERTYYIRFGAVMGMKYFADAAHVRTLLERYDAVKNPDYYVRMAIAWGISECFVKCREETLAFLRKNHLDLFTYNKALQKITESYRVTPEDKQMIRKMRRKV